ncbi:polysaccharide deacetylase family protein [Dankookia rubra]|uniref:Chitooligosaccharide deacetylase n=1 Tax=Dankookia rubra TaxID=1442381 RepID=A0A4R5QCF7_9PROT|nr:polysaccharide deacetylase family protein [Dankookia rubra]
MAKWSPTPVVKASICLHAAALGIVVTEPAGLPGVTGLIAANHAVLACGMWPRSAMLGCNLTRVTRPAPGAADSVVLTFDDGPDPEVTPRVLDLLDRNAAKASFFVIGQRAARQPQLLREIVARGHSVENHTHRHPLSFAGWLPGAMLRELRRAQEAIAGACGQAPQYFRAPAGLRSPLLDPVLAVTGLRLVSWTRRGYDAVSSCPDRVYRRMTRNLCAGDILLLHDRATAGRCMALQVLPRLLARFAAEGLSAASLRMALGEPPRGATAGQAADPACQPPAAHASR